MDVQPLDGDAQLPGGGEAGADGTGGGLLDVGVVEDQHGVLAAEFEGDADQTGGGALGDLAAGAGGAGEGDVVGVPDDLGSDDRAVTDDDLEDLGRKPRLDQQVTGPQGGQAGLGVRFHDDGVARGEGGEGVAHREFQGVVPGGDLADGPARVAQLGDLGEGRHGTGVPLGTQIRRRFAAVVACRHGDGLHLLVGVQARLAGLQLDEVEDLGLALQHEVVEAQQYGGPLPHRHLGPHALRGTGRPERPRHVLGRGLGQVGELLPGERRVVGGAAGPGDTLGELGHQLGRDHVGGGTGPLGYGGEGVRTGGGGGAGLLRGLRVRHGAQGMTWRRPLGTRR